MRSLFGGGQESVGHSTRQASDPAQRKESAMTTEHQRHALTEEIPPHLRIYLSKQDYRLYTPSDQASWRFIMAIAKDFYADHAHKKYLDGLTDTGISTERIPRIEEMDEKLRRFNWRAVPVIGFIPPAAFLEFQAHGLLPIACDMRKVENLNYTPAPDIVHEAAGHAPIIADPAYSNYLRSYGEVARRAIFSNENMNVYYAIRRLSDTKEKPEATGQEVAAAQRHLDERLAEVEYDSEVDWVTRLGWWTTEYGLVGDLENPQIYGAGLLSSIGESYHALTDEVKKIPLSIACCDQAFNITEPQPQLFVTPNFETLGELLECLAARMAFRRGGLFGLTVAKRGETVTTVELDTGLQISGIVDSFRSGAERRVDFVRFRGPVQLAVADRQLVGHDPDRHPDGYSTPLGNLRGKTCGAIGLTEADLETGGFRGDRRGRLEFDSGIVLEGRLRDRVVEAGRNLLLSFSDCEVRQGQESLYRPEWGPFDLGCGSEIRSVFGGAADRHAYQVATTGDRYEPGLHKTNLTASNRPLNEIYRRVREIREGRRGAESKAELDRLRENLDRDHGGDWLLRWELLELGIRCQLDSAWTASLREQLLGLRKTDRQVAESIDRGLQLLEKLA